jgi:hypothetical protein
MEARPTRARERRRGRGPGQGNGSEPRAATKRPARPAAAEARPPAFDPEELESHIAWMLGSPRTGSTWLMRLLVHPWELAKKTPSCLRGTGSHRRAVVPINESHFPVHLTPMKAPPFDPMQTPGPNEFLKNSRRADQASYFFAEVHADAWRPAVRRLVLERFAANVDAARRDQKITDPVVVIKEPNGSHGAELVMSLMPKAKMIFLYRDGRDVLDSQIDLRLKGRLKDRGAIDTFEKKLNLMIRYARFWDQRMKACQAAYDAHDPALRIKVRYEDLRENTFEVLKPLMEFLGLERTDEEIQAAIDAQAFEAVPDDQKGSGHGKRAATPGLWRRNINPFEQRVIEQIMGDTLVQLGYTV